MNLKPNKFTSIFIFRLNMSGFTRFGLDSYIVTISFCQLLYFLYLNILKRFTIMKIKLSLILLSFALIASFGNYRNHESKKQHSVCSVFASDASPTSVAPLVMAVADLNGNFVYEKPKYAFYNDDYVGETVRGYKPNTIPSCNSPG